MCRDEGLATEPSTRSIPGFEKKYATVVSSLANYIAAT
jgi:hypothetical protein